ncbi:hypothetical protein [Paludibaculum fermentans]|uniref:hypothetical protein n=1 Tax=Paludibaculum fermentans TaxID=1473598 RepID=UPI003EBD9718
MTQEPDGSFPPKGLTERSCRLLAGLDTGFAGAVVLVGWFLFHSWLTGEFWWAKLNVAGALFYGSPVFTMGFGRASLAGAALLLVLYSAIGALFGLLARPSGFTRNLLLGMLIALSWHLISQRYFWRRLDSFGPAYFPALSTLPAHLIYGLSLSRFANRFQRLALGFGDPSWVTALMERVNPPADGTVAVEPHPDESGEPQGPLSTPEPPPDCEHPDSTSSVPPVPAIESGQTLPPEPSKETPEDSAQPISTPAEPATGEVAFTPPKHDAGEESSPSLKSDC